MAERSQRKEQLGAVVGVGLLAFAIAWRWLLPAVDSWRASAEKRLAEPLAALAPQPLSAPTPGPARTDGPPDPLPLPVTAAPAQPPSPPLDPAQRSKVEALLGAADNALKQRHWLEPAEDNALDGYRQVLAIDPSLPAARSGLTTVLETLFQQADAALDEGDPAPTNELIAALNARGLVDPRANRLAERRALLEAIKVLLAEAASRMRAGQVLDPVDASAVASYHAVMALDRRNLAARQGLQDIESRWLKRALAAASDQRFDEADRLLGEAQSLLADSAQWPKAAARVAELKGRRAADLMLRAETALSARDIDTAETLVAEAKALGAADGAAAELEQRLTNARLYAKFQPGEKFRDDFLDHSGETPTMVVIPIGTLLMGSPETEVGRSASEGPTRSLELLQPFAMASTEVSVAEFRRFVRMTEYRTVAEKQGSSRVYDEVSGRLLERKGIDWRNDYAGGKARPNDPVVHVAWADAEAYAAWLAEKTRLNYRLPSEAEFEYVLRAGTQTSYPWGEQAPQRVVGNVTGDGDRSRSKRRWEKAFRNYRDGYWGPAPVGQFAANAMQVEDLVGNVSEWVADCWHENYLRAPNDAKPWVNRGCDRRVIRGSSWGSSPQQSRSAFRAGANADTRTARTGFRVVRDL
ncbi:MAG: SUMF1/EgtB/PvdO family nonheme iron enzyme [Lysobacterales bacterium]